MMVFGSLIWVLVTLVCSVSWIHRLGGMFTFQSRRIVQFKGKEMIKQSLPCGQVPSLPKGSQYESGVCLTKVRSTGNSAATTYTAR